MSEYKVFATWVDWKWEGWSQSISEIFTSCFEEETSSVGYAMMLTSSVPNKEQRLLVSLIERSEENYL